MRHLANLGRAHISEAEQAGCDRLLRLELKLGRHFFSKVCQKEWHELSESDLDRIHDEYFGALVGSAEVHEMMDMEAACVKAAKELGYTEGSGKAAHMAWAFVQAYGYNEWKAKASRATFYRHKKIMKAAGLSYADFQQRRVVPIRRRAIVLNQPVRSWADLLKAA
jgi:II/X family phage/plasmid replication protein